jgi:hypothetical protein
VSRRRPWRASSGARAWRSPRPTATSSSATRGTRSMPCSPATSGRG